MRQYLSTKGKHVLRGVCGMAMMLGGCNGGEEGRAEVPPQVPVAIQEMMATDFPADGEIHVHSRGEFAIEPDTYFCTFRPGYGFDGAQLREALSSIGQSDYLNGASRTSCIVAENSDPAQYKDGTVFVRFAETPNRDGTPYRIVAAVWQGDPSRGGAVWVGGLERMEGGARPEISNPFGTDPLPFEIRADVTSLSNAFIEDAM